jgi:hypothetical protein
MDTRQGQGILLDLELGDQFDAGAIHRVSPSRFSWKLEMVLLEEMSCGALNGLSYLVRSGQPYIGSRL